MDVAQLSSQYASRPDDELAEIVSSSYDLSESIVSSHPEMSQDAGFELFDRGWAQRYWKAVVSDITGLHGGDQIQSWAVGATIAGVADAIIATFGLPAVAVSGAVALAVILLRAARAAAHEDSAELDAGV
jgi:hypothetical protein